MVNRVNAAQRKSGTSARRARLTLRWRLTLVYAGMLAGVVVVLGLVLNLLVGAVLYAQELKSFHVQSRITVTRQQARFEALIEGKAPTGQRVSSLAGDCGTPMSYQQAFLDTIAVPLAYQSDYQSAFLLDAVGNVLASSDDFAVQVGQSAPYVSPQALAAFQQKVDTTRHPGLGFITDEAYTTSASRGERVGIVLIAERFQATSPCLIPASAPIVGIMEVVTNFASSQAVLSTLRLVLLLTAVAIFTAGLAVGSILIAQGLKPLTLVAQTARRIASGDLSQRVRLPHGGDEIGQLAYTFDEMAARIESAFRAQAASEGRTRQFVADASHELRTPLTAIRGYIDVLLRGAKDDPVTAQNVLTATRHETERMSRLVTDLLTLARLDEGRPIELQQTDVIALAGEAVDQARILAGQCSVSLETDGEGRLLVRVDPDQMKQVLLILLDNALKYGRTGSDGWVRVRIYRTSESVILSMTDNGQGIAAEDLPFVFDRFYRGERAASRRRMSESQTVEHTDAMTSGVRERSPTRSQAGSGLGLSIAQAIIQAHAGSLTVHSQPGFGATFTITLPRA